MSSPLWVLVQGLVGYLWVGETGAFPLVVLGSLVGRAMQRVCLEAACLLMDTAVCPPCCCSTWGNPALEPWSVGWDQVLVPKWQSYRERTLSNNTWGFCHHGPCPHSEPQPIPPFLGDPPRPAVRSSPGSYGVTALPWVPVHVKLCVHPPRVESLCPPVCETPAFKPH